MRAAGLPPDGRYLIAVMAAEADRVTGPNADRWRCDLAGELIVPLAEGALGAPFGDEVVVLVSAPADPDAHQFAARIREAQAVVESDRSRVRLTVGVSAPAENSHAA